MSWIGPRKIGGVYYNGYWRKSYTVMAFGRHPRQGIVSITVQWDDGTETTHCTAWNPDRDVVVAEPSLI
jgi:hypothetical protein